MEKLTKILSALLFAGLFSQGPAQALIINMTIIKSPTGQIVYLLGDLHTRNSPNPIEEALYPSLYKVLEQNNKQETSILIEMPEAKEDRIFQQEVSNKIQEPKSPTRVIWEDFFDQLTYKNPLENISIKCVDFRGCIFSLQAIREQEEAYLSKQIDQSHQESIYNHTLRDAYETCKKTYELSKILQKPEYFQEGIDYYKNLSPESYQYKEHLLFDVPLQEVLFNDGIESQRYGHSSAYLCKLFNGPFITDGFDIPALYEITKEDAARKIVVIAGTAHCGAIQNYLIQVGYEITTKIARFEKSADKDRQEVTRLFKEKQQPDNEKIESLLKKILSKSIPINAKDLELIDNEKLAEFLAASTIS